MDTEKWSPEELRDMEHWKNAQTFEDMCELDAQYIEGKRKYFPLFTTEFSGDSDLVAEYLAAFNRGGFMTIDSQAGLIRKDGCYKQRAYVCGFALKATALRIAKLSLFNDLHISIFTPDEEDENAHFFFGWDGYKTPVTADYFRPCTWSGDSGFEALEHYGRICSEQAMRELQQAWYVSIVDLVWGRTDYLWETLAHELCYSIEPDLDEL